MLSKLCIRTTLAFLIGLTLSAPAAEAKLPPLPSIKHATGRLNQMIDCKWGLATTVASCYTCHYASCDIKAPSTPV